MKHVLKWAGIFLGTIGLGAVIMFGIPLLFGLLFVTGLEAEWNAMDDDAQAALCEIGLSNYTEYATWHDLSIGGTFTAFELAQYDNREDHTDLRAGVMAHAAKVKEWHVEETAVHDYMEYVNAYIPEAAFLCPSDEVVFDAKYINLVGTEPSKLAFFDQDTGLMIYLCTYVQPHAGSIKADGLKVPHNDFVYEMETHGGFLGDGRTFQAFIVPEEERTALEATLASHADWRAGTVTHAEYVHLHNHEFYTVPPLYPASDVTFDWWCYVDTFARANRDFESEYTPDNSDFPAVMREAGARPGGNWLVGLYDADTGLFIYYEYDS